MQHSLCFYAVLHKSSELSGPCARIESLIGDFTAVRETSMEMFQIHFGLTLNGLTFDIK